MGGGGATVKIEKLETISRGPSWCVRPRVGYVAIVLKIMKKDEAENERCSTH